MGAFCSHCLVESHKVLRLNIQLLCAAFHSSQSDAESMMDQLVHWVRVDSSGLGRPQLPGDRPVNSMAVPMMLLCLVDQLTEGRAELAEKYRELGDWCVSQILQHVQVCEACRGHIDKVRHLFDRYRCISCKC